jgi:hypothetical protein
MCTLEKTGMQLYYISSDFKSVYKICLEIKDYGQHLKRAEGIGLVGYENVDARTLTLTGEGILDDLIVEGAQLVGRYQHY